MPTKLRYHDDPLLLDHQSAVIAHATWKGAPSVILDDTIFYPEAGGQLADRGTLAGVAVVDVQIDDALTVHHLLDPQAALPPVGDRVRAQVEKSRRRQFMAQHTGQHMLSRALLDVAKAETVSSRLGETVSTIDVDVPNLVDRAVAEAESIVNAVIDDDVGVRAWFPTPDELRALPLRRQPKVAENVRVIDVDAFDVSPCGGTHCTRTSQIGFVRVVGLERYKGMMRVSFLAGAQGRAQVFSRARTIEELAKQMSSSPDDVPASLEKLRTDLKAARDESGALVEQLAQHVARQLTIAQPSGTIVAVLDGGQRMIRAVAPLLQRDCILASPSDDGLAVIVMSASSSSFDSGAVLKALVTAAGGKGGGKKDRAEGRMPSVPDFVERARAIG